LRQLILLGTVLAAGQALADDPLPPLTPRVRVADLNVGESAELTLCDGSTALVELIGVTEHRDEVCFAGPKSP
jgi:hypothetical protein